MEMRPAATVSSPSQTPLIAGAVVLLLCKVLYSSIKIGSCCLKDVVLAYNKTQQVNAANK